MDAAATPDTPKLLAPAWLAHSVGTGCLNVHIVEQVCDASSCCHCCLILLCKRSWAHGGTGRGAAGRHQGPEVGGAGWAGEAVSNTECPGLVGVVYGAGAYCCARSSSARWLVSAAGVWCSLPGGSSNLRSIQGISLYLCFSFSLSLDVSSIGFGLCPHQRPCIDVASTCTRGARMQGCPLYQNPCLNTTLANYGFQGWSVNSLRRDSRGPRGLFAAFWLQQRGATAARQAPMPNAQTPQQNRLGRNRLSS